MTISDPTEEPAEARVELHRIGRYVVLGEIGIGGMGVVLAAFDPDLDRSPQIGAFEREAVCPGVVRWVRMAQSWPKT